MKAILMHAPGGPEVLKPAEVARPELRSETDILVRLKAAGVNPVDTKLRSRGTYYPDRMPAILGCDGAGVVEDAGSGVTRFRMGDEVYFCNGGIGGEGGTYADYAVVDERFAALKPANLDFTEAAAAPLVLITAWESLHDRGRIIDGQDVLIHAGAGGVGHVAVQLAKIAGCRVITTLGNGDKAALARKFGADEVVLYKDTDFVEAVHAWCGDEDGVDLAFDTVGGQVFTDTFRTVRPYGKVVTLLQPGPDTDWKHARLRNLSIDLELMLSPMFFGWSEAQQHQAWILEQCSQLFERDELKINLTQVFPLERAADAHRLLEAGGMTGKAVLRID